MLDRIPPCHRHTLAPKQPRRYWRSVSRLHNKRRRLGGGGVSSLVGALADIVTLLLVVSLPVVPPAQPLEATLEAPSMSGDISSRRRGLGGVAGSSYELKLAAVHNADGVERALQVVQDRACVGLWDYEPIAAKGLVVNRF